MSDHETNNENPYQAPTQPAEFQGLASDTEFLISGECVLCEDSVDLPAVCIKTGETNDLVAISRRLTYFPQKMLVVGVLLLMVVLPVAGQIVFHFGSPTGPTAGSQESEFMLLWFTLAVVAAITVGAWVLFFRRKRRVSATWYVSQAYEAKCRRDQRIAAIRAIAVSVGCVAFVLASESSFSLLFFCLPIVLFLLLRGPGNTQPNAVTVHNGLVVLVGFSPQFIAKVEEMIQRHNRPR